MENRGDFLGLEQLQDARVAFGKATGLRTNPPFWTHLLWRLFAGLGWPTGALQSRAAGFGVHTGVAQVSHPVATVVGRVCLTCVERRDDRRHES